MTGHIKRETCDECGPNVVAWVYVEMPSGLPLAYCGHHGTKYKDALTGLGATVYDYVYMLMD